MRAERDSKLIEKARRSPTLKADHETKQKKKKHTMRPNARYRVEAKKVAKAWSKAEEEEPPPSSSSMAGKGYSSTAEASLAALQGFNKKKGPKKFLGGMEAEFTVKPGGSLKESKVAGKPKRGRPKKKRKSDNRGAYSAYSEDE